jgi:hypothetical protein
VLDIDWMHLLIVAAIGATATVGLKTGNLWPFSRTINRKDAPRKYWAGIGLCFLIVAMSVATTVWQIRNR